MRLFFDKLVNYSKDRQLTPKEKKLNRLTNVTLLLTFLWAIFLSVALIVLYGLLLATDAQRYGPYLFYYLPVLLTFTLFSVITYIYRFSFRNPIALVIIQNMVSLICLGIIGIFVGREGNTYLIMITVLPLPYYYLKAKYRRLLVRVIATMLFIALGFGWYVFTHEAILPTPKLNTDISQALVAIGIATVILQIAAFSRYSSDDYETQIATITEDLQEKDKKIQIELNFAGETQRTLLPLDFDETNRLSFHIFSQPYNQVTGDYIDVIHQGPDTYIVLADISGHGVPAALISILARQSFRAKIRAGGNPAEIMRTVNLELCDLLITQDYLTGVLLKIDESRKLTFACGSHPPPLLVRRGPPPKIEPQVPAGVKPVQTQEQTMPTIGQTKGQTEGHEGQTTHPSSVTALDAAGFILGCFEDPPVAFEDRSLQLLPGDRLVIFTDGLTEMKNTNREEYGRERLKDTCLKLAHLSSTQLLAELVSLWRDFAAKAPNGDDVTLLVTEVHP